MVADNDAPLGTAFTVSVDFRHGMTTGISAEERCNTIRALANANAGAADFVRPGHVFPLIARDGGVLMRSGHTEAAVDLCRLAGLEPVGVLAELVNDDGTVKRGADVDRALPRSTACKLVSVADLIAWRQRSEKLVERVAEFAVSTEAGPARAYAYHLPFDATQHLALVFGDIGDGIGVPVRLHRESVIDDVFGARTACSTASSTSWRGTAAASSSICARARSAWPREGGRTRDSRPSRRMPLRRAPSEWREVGLGAQILRDLGVKSIRLIASRERHYVGLDGFGIEIEATEIFER